MRSRESRVATFLFLITTTTLLQGCNPAQSDNTHSVEWRIEPTPPVVGNSHVTLTLRDDVGKAVDDATVTIEANMSHPGMTPVTARALHDRTGRYAAPLNLTMAGDWILFASITLADGRVLQRQLNLAAVRR